ncbi:MAG: hypothetical protein ABFD14_12845 [Anaerolineaceae bacterium]
MNIITNHKLIKRNRKIGQIATYVSLGILVIGLLITFFRKEEFFWSIGALILGFIISQVGIYYGKNWGPSPRQDELLAASLKGLDDKYTLYNYTSPIPYLLVGPSGVSPLIPLNQGGLIRYNPAKKRYTQKGGNFYMKLFGQEGIGSPDLDAAANRQTITNFLKDKFTDGNFPEPDPILVFINPKATLDMADSPFTGVTAEKLKDVVRRKAKSNPASLDMIDQIRSLMVQEDIL